MSKIRDLANHMDSRPENCEQFFSDAITNSSKSRYVVDRDGSIQTFEIDDLTVCSIRRRSVSAQPRIHPAVRLAAFAMKSSVTTKAKHLELHVNSESDEFSENDQIMSVSSKKLRPTRYDTSLRRRDEWLRRVSSGSPRQSSNQTVSTTRILRPRYPRTPTPKSALLLRPMLSPRNLRKSTLKSRPLFPPLSTSFTTDTANSSSQSSGPGRNHTPKSRTSTLTPKSGARRTTVGRRTPRNKTPSGVKCRESSTPKASRSGTPKGTPKSLKENSSYVCEICAEVILEKKEMLKHQRLHDKNRILDKTSTPNKAVLIRTPKSGKKNHGKFQCDICQKNFRFRSNLKSHRLIHEQPKMFKCRSCEKSLLIVVEGADRLLVESLVKPETGSSEVVCKDCCYGDTTLKDGGRKLRKRRGHCFMCDKCPKTFGSETNLKIHLKTHAIEKIRDILKGTSSRFTAE